MLFILIFSFIFSTVPVSPVIANPGTRIYVDPRYVKDTAKTPGTNFTVNINVAEVSGLLAYDFKLKYDTAVLNATKIEVGSFFDPDYTVFRKIPPPYDLGYAQLGVTQIYGEPGVSGSGTLAIVTFTVISTGESKLELYNTKLSAGVEQPISHETYHGHFSNTGFCTPVAAFKFEPDSPLVEIPVKFDASYDPEVPEGFDASTGIGSYDPDGTIDSWNWDFGDGNTGSGEIVWYAYHASGTYNVTLTVTDNEDHTNTAKKEITVFGHDIAVTNVQPNQTYVLQNNTISIKVKVKNKAPVREDPIQVIAYYNYTQMAPPLEGDIFLDPFTTKTVTFLWDTYLVPNGTYTIWARARFIVPEIIDDYPADNILIDGTVTVVLEMVRDIAVIKVTSSPRMVMVGDPVNINVTVANQGFLQENFNASIYYDTYLIKTKTNITIPALESQTTNVDGKPTTTGWEGWTRVGDSPWLSAPDYPQHYIYTSAPNDKIGNFTFQNVTKGITWSAVTLRIKTWQDGDEVDDYMNIRLYDGSVWSSTYTVIPISYASPGTYVDVDVSSFLSTESKINATKMAIQKITVGSYDDTIYLDHAYILLSGVKYCVPFTWNTAGVTWGNHSISARVSEVPNEINKTNNNLTDDMVTVALNDINVAPLYVHPKTAVVGTEITIETTLKNLARQNATCTVSFYYDNTWITNQTVEDIPGSRGTKSLSVTWDTGGVPAGTHIIKAEVPPLEGEFVVSDNIRTEEVTLEQAVHDIAITDLTADPTTVLRGRTVNINVTIKNQGNMDETVSASVSYDTTPIETKTGVVILAGESKTLNFTWNTLANIALKTYTIKAEVPQIPGETDTTDNTKTTEVTVKIHDIAVVSVTASKTEVVVGGSVVVTVIVKNQGNFTESFSVTAKYNDNTIGTINVNDLAEGGRKTLNFPWSTTGVSPGTYKIKASVSTVTDEDDITNNIQEDGTVKVKLIMLGSAITISATPNTVTVGAEVTISGSINLTRPGVKVTIWYRIHGTDTWNNLTATQTNATSQYAYTWAPQAAGTYELKASWEGDANTLPAESNVFPITVNELTPPPPGIPLWLILAVGAVIIVIIAIAVFIRRR